MTKFTSADVVKLAGRLKRAKDRGHPAHFLVGAGCSISAGIPSAADLIKTIHKEYEAECAALGDDKRHSYGACMALLSINERRDLIRPYLEAAKINWGTIALAQFIAEGFVERVLTVNFDLVLENACGLLGLQPAVYDFGVAPASDPAMVVSPAVVHLHGQSYGLVLLNTEEETQKHRNKLQPILLDTLRNAPLVVIGYSGSADGISQNLVDEFESREPLYWVGYADELATHLHGFLKKDHFNFLGGADFDRFMIELAQSLGCWPPQLFSNPLGHLLKGLSPVVSYPVGNSDEAIDLLSDLRGKIEALQHKLREEDHKHSLQELYMKRDFEGIAKAFDSRTVLSDEDRTIAYWSFVEWGDALSEQSEHAGEPEASRLNMMAGQKYAAALKIMPGGYESLYNWGSLLSDQAERASGKEAVRLFEEAVKKYEAALAIKDNDFDILKSLGDVLFELAERAEGEDAARLLASAGEKYAVALAVRPRDGGVLNEWGNLLLEQAKGAEGEDAERLFRSAGENYQAALAIVPDKHEVLTNWGNLLSEQAGRASGDEASRFFALAGEKYEAALAIKPNTREALNNWGNLLWEQANRVGGEDASRLLAAAGEKYAEALAVEPNDHEVLENWGRLLLEQAKRASGDDAARLFALAEEKLKAALRIDSSETYYLACLEALRGDEQQCRQYLERAEKHMILLDFDDLDTDPDLETMKDKPWFQELLSRQKKSKN